MHISDWLPTMLSWAGASHLTEGLSLDGIYQSEALKSGQNVRENMLVEYFTNADSHDNKSMAAYRKGKYKVIYLKLDG